MKHLDDEGLLYTARNTNQNFVGHVTLIMQMQCAFVDDDDGLWECSKQSSSNNDTSNNRSSGRVDSLKRLGHVFIHLFLGWPNSNIS